MDDANITIDLTDLSAMRVLMDTYNNYPELMLARTNTGESVLVSIRPDHIIADTTQQNGWIRRNVLWRDGSSEELYSK